MALATNLPDQDILSRLVELDREIKDHANLHDRVTALIGACIAEGVDSGQMITRALAKLGFNKQHVGKLLSVEAHGPRGDGLWWRDQEGRYHLTDDCFGGP